MLFCGVPRYFEASFNLSALLSSFCLWQASCSSPLVNPLQAVSPSYSTTFPALPHVSLYIQPHFSHNFHPLSCKKSSFLLHTPFSSVFYMHDRTWVRRKRGLTSLAFRNIVCPKPIKYDSFFSRNAL